MSVIPMKHLTAVVMRNDASALIRSLMHMNCVEVRKDEGISSFSVPNRTETENEYTELKILIQKLEKTIKLLTPLAPSGAMKEVGIFGNKPVIAPDSLDSSSGKYLGAFMDAERVEEIGYEKLELESENGNISASLITLSPWEECKIPLETSGTKETVIFFGTLPKNITEQNANDALEECYGAVNVISNDGTYRYVIAICKKGNEGEFLRRLSSLSFTRLDFRDFEGLASANIARLKKEKSENEKKLAELDDEMKMLAENISEIRFAYDYSSTRLAGLEARLQLCETETTATLTGWIPAKAEDDVRKLLDSGISYYEIRDPYENEDAPVKLKNPEPFSAFEGVLGMYSMPKYGSYDPTIIMSVFYFIIFGFMLADVAYGIIISIACALILKFTDLGRGAKQLIKMFEVCGISCTIAGVLFGSYFGDFPAIFCEKMLGIDLQSLALWFDPVSDPMMFLILSVAIGLVHMMAGIVVKAIVLIKNGEVFAGIFDQLTWVLLFAGIVVAIVISKTVGIVMTGIAVVALVLTQGREQKNPVMKLLIGIKSLYGIMNYVSDLLSYSRIMALGLSSAVVASVMNTLSTLVGPSVIGYIVMIVIFLVGHILNIAINLLGTFVHTSRLQYIEFFGKFFEDGGKPFNPLTEKLKYTKLKE